MDSSFQRESESFLLRKDASLAVSERKQKQLCPSGTAVHVGLLLGPPLLMQQSPGTAVNNLKTHKQVSAVSVSVWGSNRSSLRLIPQNAD